MEPYKEAFNTLQETYSKIDIERAKLDDEKEALINLIMWYRDSYHQKDFGHTKMIEEISFGVNNREQLEMYWQALDGWL